MQTPIEDSWADLAHSNERPVFRRVDDAHPLDLYAGLGTGDERTLMLVTASQPASPPTYDTITVICRRRADGNWALLIALPGKELAIPFARLCQDLIETTRLHPQHGASVLINRLGRWRRLLELAKRQLSEQSLRGLLGELIILKQAILPRYGPVTTVNSWVGPYDAPQDFVVAGRAIEVKAITPTATRMTISSLEQLQANTPLIIATVLLTPAGAQDPGAFTPADLVDAVREVIGEAPRAAFDERLTAAGYEDRPEYHNTWYQATGKKYYRVANDFPRLTRTSIPDGITAATYEISIDHCAPFEVTEDASWT